MGVHEAAKRAVAIILAQVGAIALVAHVVHGGLDMPLSVSIPATLVVTAVLSWWQNWPPVSTFRRAAREYANGR